MFPVRPEQLPELISVVLVAAAQSEADLIRIACDTPALHVRGRVIAQHARHLAALHPRLAPHLDEEAVRLWEQAEDGIPRDLLATASHVTTEEEAAALAEHMRGRQEGYAHVRYGSAEHAAAMTDPEYGGSGHSTSDRSPVPTAEAVSKTAGASGGQYKAATQYLLARATRIPLAGGAGRQDKG
ncbi:hypothetical protein GPECTOR_1235g493 [Gonium pectorale]|uniref:DUF222 domain-containing protein n=1 Tax=Gonium pectorale TaxID=33097 RepID=A0A150FTK9_GONPE|nr:hypothetical protein GPECTOR_1235g493 [Gonium pectorale]|eukprot:KXZ40939.1 hypothetical protein GPECTOR_1235g493 [Gonium pectorale]